MSDLADVSNLPPYAHFFPPFIPPPTSLRAGLVLPVTTFYKRLKRIRAARRISMKSAVYIAAVLEYLVAEVLELAGNAASQDHGKKRIEPRHLCVAVYADAELRQVVNGAVFSQGGIIPKSFLYEIEEEPE
ncbi:core histone H2A/H2B/H3/H4 [Ancylostoma caninum]|uniref:Histone H2A n=1 Tax=Ancylostoma caninum TaxID=29170 RepID=A0A368GVH2_ANCCA|nr:core histone H2A/H2B/H3/H4 [Ancylostoma caninum]